MYSFTITEWRVKDNLGDLGHDTITFYLDVVKEGQAYYGLITYRHIYKFCQQQLPDTGQYLTGVRNNITGFGPKETKVWAMLQAEEFDMEPLLYQFLAANPGWLMPRKTKPMTREQSEKLNKIVEDLGDSANTMRDGNIREIAFMDKLLEDLTAMVQEYYPEIFESDPEDILELENILVKNIQNLASDLDKIS